ncbi:MAG TPA: hypothetical protein VFU36_16395 [Jatrophihabitans sp.]|nr:hypothetical protein [Jatrophihabitans sp.]
MTSTERLIQRVTESLLLGHEAQGFEVKGPGSAKGQFLGKVVRAALGLGNLRNGGLVVIGVNDKDLRSLGPGLTDAEAKTWESYDVLSGKFAEYADPPLQFHSELLTLEAGTDHETRVCVIEVDEFPEIPHICRKQLDYEPEEQDDTELDNESSKHNKNKKKEAPLRRGAVYVRSRQKPETTEIASAEQMRDLLDLATEKALARLIQTVQRAGATLTPEDLTPAPPDTDLFNDEQEDGWQ